MFNIRENSLPASPVKPYGLSDFQLKALDQITFEACKYGQWYLDIKLDIVMDDSHQALGHQLKITTLNSDGRIWINANSFTVEDVNRIRISDELDSHDNLTDFTQYFLDCAVKIFVKQ